MKSFFILILVSIIGLGVALGVIYYTEAEKASQSVALPSMKMLALWRKVLLKKFM